MDSWIATRLPELSLTAVIDILVVAFLIYQVAILIRGTRAAHILIGIIVIGLVYNAAIWARLEVLQSILSGLMPYTAIAVVVLFHPEIRRALARVGRRRFGRSARRRESTEEIMLAVAKLSETKTGALIVMERNIGLRTFIESGVPLDARVSRDLLLSIFQKGQALHDGAVILQKDRVSAAACFLPLTMNPSVSLQ
ncbi:MAG: TIGR00159 family protein, partial [Bryobacterales bacterium]|nr:TIGR00159 family protein [Bryobacterales bacterium]